ncbi:MAG: hypothetical protein RR253_01220 [Oscillospiraceae bacterium]
MTYPKLRQPLAVTDIGVGYSLACIFLALSVERAVFCLPRGGYLGFPVWVEAVRAYLRFAKPAIFDLPINGYLLFAKGWIS